MARGTAWSVLRTMFKAEIGVELNDTVASGDNARYLQLANNQIKTLIAQDAWLLGETEATVNLVAGTRYYTFPETTVDIDRLDKSKPLKVVNASGYETDVLFGIGAAQYNQYGNQTAQDDPIRRWRHINIAGVLKLEVWPIPSRNALLTITGIGVFTPMTGDASVCPIDDTLLMHFMAAKQLARDKSSDAQANLVQGNAILNNLKAARPSAHEVISLKGGGNGLGRMFNRPVAFTNGISN